MEKSSISQDSTGEAMPPEGFFNMNDNTPLIELTDDQGWNFWKNSDEQHVRIMISYAEYWAEIMEFRLENGEALDNIWLEVAETAINGDEPIDLATQRKAARILAKHWANGEKLRHLYNAHPDFD